jgi:hypothetical protein
MRPSRRYGGARRGDHPKRRRPCRHCGIAVVVSDRDRWPCRTMRHLERPAPHCRKRHQANGQTVAIYVITAVSNHTNSDPSVAVCAGLIEIDSYRIVSFQDIYAPLRISNLTHDAYSNAIRAVASLRLCDGEPSTSSASKEKSRCRGWGRFLFQARGASVLCRPPVSGAADRLAATRRLAATPPDPLANEGDCAVGRSRMFAPWPCVILASRWPK